MSVGKASGRQGQEDLGQRIKRQHDADFCRAVALAQGQERGRHAQAGHAGMNADLNGNEACQFAVERK